MVTFTLNMKLRDVAPPTEAGVAEAYARAADWLKEFYPRGVDADPEQDSPCGDYPAPCNCDNPDTHDKD